MPDCSSRCARQEFALNRVSPARYTKLPTQPRNQSHRIRNTTHLRKGGSQLSPPLPTSLQSYIAALKNSLTSHAQPSSALAIGEAESDITALPNPPIDTKSVSVPLVRPKTCALVRSTRPYNCLISNSPHRFHQPNVTMHESLRDTNQFTYKQNISWSGTRAGEKKELTDTAHTSKCRRARSVELRRQDFVVEAKKSIQRRCWKRNDMLESKCKDSLARYCQVLD